METTIKNVEELDLEYEEDEEDVEEKIQLLMGDIDDLIYEQNKRQIPYYAYQAEKYLNLDDDDIQQDDAKTFTIIVYTINTDAINPFIQYLLFKNDDLDFIEFKKQYNVMSQAIEIMEKIAKAFKSNTPFQYKGFKRIEDTSYLFFEMFSIDCHILFSINDLCFVLLDEILNDTKSIFPIKQKVKNFFKDNIELALLVDEQENCYEIPCLAFAGYRKKKVEFYGTFGNPPLSFSLNQYLFKDYDSACEDAYNSALKNGDNNYGGIVRFAIFFGRTEYIDKSMEVTFSDDCESSIINLGENNVHFLLKHYEQQCPLSIHYINNNNSII
jgi:hypothetical protein